MIKKRNLIYILDLITSIVSNFFSKTYIVIFIMGFRQFQLIKLKKN